ncbi:MAG: phage major capsid protein [Lachnospiraceae bacterium]|nr:phage major capsid protein [Lachnospiraceae bacterium]
MNREELLKLSKKELKARLSALSKDAQAKSGEELAACVDEAKLIDEILGDILAREELAKAALAAAGDDGMAAGEEFSEAKDKKRDLSGAKAKAGKGVTYPAKAILANNMVKSDDAVMPRHESPQISPTFNDVPSLIDRVTIVPLAGGESYEKPFVKSYGAGTDKEGNPLPGAAATAEGAEYSETEPVFGYSKIIREKITAYSEITEELKKLPNADYDSVVEDSVTKSIRRYSSRQILIGDGTLSKFRGIFFNPASEKERVIDPATDKAITAIDEDTLIKIIFAYGGDEEVEDEAILILSKADLEKFALAKKKDGNAAYDIQINGNTGRINSVKFVISSACKSLATAKKDDYLMAYGPLSLYEVAVFSDLDAQKSDHYKFRQGITAFKASVFMGGNVVAWNGFLRVKKG